MKHLIICSEYPGEGIPPGGIGTYVYHLSRLFAERGETVHVISKFWEENTKTVEEQCQGKLIIHRLPGEDLELLSSNLGTPTKEVMALLGSGYPPQCFSWQASRLAEKLVDEEEIDVIESQEFQAPFYYFQLRRALGLGPRRRPPCIVHIHSPTELVARHNNWDTNYVYFRTAKRLEEYSIAHSNALICPSRYMAQQAEEHYGLERNTIHVIPYPLGDCSFLERKDKTWEEGSICYVGRLERRKGMIEWLNAAVSAARDYPQASFDFIGSDILGLLRNDQEMVYQHIPEDLIPRFRFYGKQDRSSLPRFLLQARIAVVPSRWENFPNTCMEAMCSGLPVIATREGGMREMIQDGRNGWLTRNPGVEGLEESLRRALETPPAQLAEMGRSASLDIQQMCDNNKIVESHLRFREQVIQRSVTRSLSLPHRNGEGSGQEAQSSSETGIAVIVLVDSHQLVGECLASIEQQTCKPAAVLVISDGSIQEMQRDKRWPKEWEFQQCKNLQSATCKNAAIEAVLSSERNPIGFTFVDVRNRLRTDFIALCESILQHCPNAGLVSFWIHDKRVDRTSVAPCPGFPYQWLSNEVAAAAVIRTEALRATGFFRDSMSDGYDAWDLFNALIASGWDAVTIPEILADHCDLEPKLPVDGHDDVRMYRAILERFPDLVTRDAKDIALLMRSDRVWPRQQETLLPPETVIETQKAPRISAIICTYNRAAYLKSALKSLVHQSLPMDQYEIVVVDNCSTDNTKEVVEQFSDNSNISYIQESTLGLSFARNAGWRNAKGEYVAFLDDDAIASPSWLERILNVFETVQPKPGCVGGRTEPIWESPRPVWLADWLLHGLAIIEWSQTPHHLANLSEEWLVGANMAFPADLLQRLGGFVPNLDRMGNKLLSSGDVFLEKQIMKLGFSCYYHPEISVRHHIPPSRLNQTWFIRRYFWQGVSNAVMQLLEKQPSLLKRFTIAVTQLKFLLKSPAMLRVLLLPTQDSELFRKRCFALLRLGHFVGILTAKRS